MAPLCMLHMMAANHHRQSNKKGCSPHSDVQADLPVNPNEKGLTGCG